MTAPAAETRGPEDGPVLVLGSSLGTTKEMWRPQLDALAAAGIHVVAYDHRGHGDSPAPPPPYELADLGRDVLDLLDARGIERAAVGGLSLGGMVAMWLAAHAPERVTALAVLASSAYFPDASVWEDRAETVRREGSTAGIAEAVVERWLTPAYAAAHPDERAWLKAQLESADPDGYAACCGAIQRMDLRDELASVRGPSLVVGGAQDPATPPELHARVIAERLPGAWYEELSPAAHCLNVERRAEVSALLRDLVLGS